MVVTSNTAGVSVPNNTTIVSLSSNTAVLSNNVSGTGTPTFSAIGPSDTAADGGGIILDGTTDHTFTWSNANDSWQSSENMDLVNGKTYNIIDGSGNARQLLSLTQIGPTAGTGVVSGLGTGVTSSVLTSVGTLSSLGVSGATTLTGGLASQASVGSNVATPITLSNDATTGDGTNPDVASLGFVSSGAQKASIRSAVYGEGWMAFHNNNDTEKMRLTSGGDLILGRSDGFFTYNDTGADNIILDVYGGTTAGNRGILSLSGRTGSDNGLLGTIWFNNANNSGASPGNTMKLAAAIQANAVTANGNSSNNSGAYLSLMTKQEAGTLQERVRITDDGHVLFSGLTTHNDSTRNINGITLKSPAGISFQNFGANGSRNWRIRPDDLSLWGSLDFSVGTTDNDATSWPSAGTDIVLSLHKSGAVSKNKNPCLKTAANNNFGSVGSLTTNTANTGILQTSASIDKGDNGWTTTGANAYTFVCPVDGIYVVHAHVSYGIGISGRQIWVMSYTLGGGNLPLSSYVEIIDHDADEFGNYSYYDTYEFTAGTRIGMGKNGGSGTLTGQSLQWGCHLLQ